MDSAKVTAYSDSDIQAIASEYKSYDESAAEDFKMTTLRTMLRHTRICLWMNITQRLRTCAKQEIKQGACH